jgi:hypothetical protein
MKAGLPLLALTAALAACVPAAKAPAPAPAPVARPAPTPTRPAPAAPLPVAPSVGWMDAALTPGAWRYANQSGGGVAQFTGAGGAPLLMIECDRETGPGVRLYAFGQRASRLAIIRTETATRSLPLTAGEGFAEAMIAPGDSLLDAMALSKGRFAVEVDGLPPLYLPSHAEVSRVIEDCR